jgi:hypothetical protein
MNVAPTSKLLPGHQRLEALVGAWRGEEKGGGLFVTENYRQLCDGAISFEARNVFLNQRFKGSGG